LSWGKFSPVFGFFPRSLYWILHSWSIKHLGQDFWKIHKYWKAAADETGGGGRFGSLGALGGMGGMSDSLLEELLPVLKV